MNPTWRNIVGAVAPALATALGGPLAGLAVSQVSGALLGKPNGTDAELNAAVAAGGADALLQLKQADLAFAAKMAELDVDLERIAAGDRDSARSREAKTGDTATPRWLAGGITSGFFGALAWLLVYGKPADGGDVLLVMLGSLGTAWTSVIAYFFGSTKGSAEKTRLLAASSKD